MREIDAGADTNAQIFPGGRGRRTPALSLFSPPDSEPARWGAMTTRRGPLARAVAAAFSAAPPAARDAATVALAKAYATLIDDASDLHAAAVDAVQAWDREDPVGRAGAQRLADALSARQAVIELGPKLLAALAALHMTPAARGKVEGGKPRDPVAAHLDELRNRRDRRRAGQRGAAAVDTPAP